MITPVFIHRMKDQRGIGVALSCLILVGYVGLYLDPAHALPWMIVMGLGSGGALVLSITLFSLRVETATQSVALSGMAQAVGYFGGRGDADLHRLHPRPHAPVDAGAAADDRAGGVAAGDGLSGRQAANDRAAARQPRLALALEGNVLACRLQIAFWAGARSSSPATW